MESPYGESSSSSDKNFELLQMLVNDSDTKKKKETEWKKRRVQKKKMDRSGFDSEKNQVDIS